MRLGRLKKMSYVFVLLLFSVLGKDNFIVTIVAQTIYLSTTSDPYKFVLLFVMLL